MVRYSDRVFADDSGQKVVKDDSSLALHQKDGATTFQ